jgi:hypothetical protein
MQYADKLDLWREALHSEELWLEELIESMQETDEEVREFTHKAKLAMLNYEELGDEVSLGHAEAYAKLALATKERRVTLTEVRKQRERVQWYRRKVNQLAKQTLSE